eukprot:NODE_1012_length_630_cov_46.098107_g940_i0.p2 GENE.NODE_1012_length_630_cov_46.098107_g940_i0~~NODE_1012_length_630_cov_46.098107_g940_i0.p2  ORF type:complete len:64 (+),score=6.72 NODE_1012_length_630_cov_46.098107_g940_i0:328-519(+)
MQTTTWVHHSGSTKLDHQPKGELKWGQGGYLTQKCAVFNFFGTNSVNSWSFVAKIRTSERGSF